MVRSPSLLLAATLSMHCSGGEGSESTSSSSTSSTSSSSSTTDPTGDATAVVTGSSTDATTDATTGTSTTGTTVTTEDPTTGPAPTSDISAGDGTTNGGPAPEFDCGALPAGVVGVEYLGLLEATGGMGGPYYWELGFNDALPPGLTLSADDPGDLAQIAGVPTEAGTFEFTIILSSNGTEAQGQEQCQIEIAAAAGPGGSR